MVYIYILPMHACAMQIPCRPTPNAGVTVEQGAGDTYFVQVTCRDRRGLLGDIINALRLMPLEVRGRERAG